MLFYTSTLLIYYRFALVNHIAEDLHGVKEQFISQGDVYTKEIEQLAPDRDRLIAYLQSTADQQQSTFTISDLDGHDIIHIGKTEPGIWTLHSKTVAYVNGKADYIVDIKMPERFGELLIHMNSSLRLLYVAVCSIGFALLLLMIYLHYDVVARSYP